MKYLFLLNRKFPYKYGEAFLENEIEELPKYFDKIYIYPSNIKKGTLPSRVIKSECIESRLIEKFDFNMRKYLYVLKIPFYFFYTNSNNNLKKRLEESFFLSASYSQAKKIIEDFKKLNIQKDNDIYIYSYWLYVNAKVGSLLKDYCIKNNYKNVKFISRAHAFDIYEEKRKNKYLPQRKEILDSVDAVYACSNDGKNYLQKKYPKYKRKIFTSYLGTYDHKIQKYKKHTNFNILSCSRIGAFKRVDLIVDILKKLDKKNTNITWTHIGSGDGFNDLLLKCKHDLKFIKFNLTGSKKNSEVYDYYLNNDVDLFINVSSAEGLPVSIMEAISFGIPVIATRAGGTSEIVDNKNGYIIDIDFKEEEVAKLIDNIRLMEKSEYLKLRNESRKKWELKFNAPDNYKMFSKCILEDNKK